MIATTTDLLLFFTTSEITWIVAIVMVLLYAVFCAGVALLNAVFDLSDEAAAPAEPLADEEERGRLALPEPTPKPSARRSPAASRAVESSHLLAPAAPSPALPASPAAAAAPAARDCCESCWAKLRRAAFAPPRLFFTHTVPMPDKPFCFGRRLWPLTVFMCILYTLALSFTMARAPARPRDPTTPPHRPPMRVLHAIP